MLTLTRRPGEGITIRVPSGEEVYLSIGMIMGNQIRINFDAPKDVIIFRDELYPYFDKKKEGSS